MAVPLSAAPLQNEYNMRLMKLPSLQQRAVLRRAILDDGNACGRVTVAAWRGPYANLQRWEAVCDRGGSYAIFIGLDSTVQVRDCPSLATLKLPVCRPVATPPAQKIIALTQKKVRAWEPPRTSVVLYLGQRPFAPPLSLSSHLGPVTLTPPGSVPGPNMFLGII